MSVEFLNYLNWLKIDTRSLCFHHQTSLDIDFNLSYIKPNTHIKMIYNDICLKYKNIEEYKFIPIGWSMGGGMALYFCQKYKQQCIHCILLDPIYITPFNMLPS